MSRAHKKHPGRILFVGSGPGDAALVTVRAREVLGRATLAFTDPDVDKGVLALIGIAVEPGEDGERPVDVRPALGDPAEVAKTLIAVARGGHDVAQAERHGRSRHGCSEAHVRRPGHGKAGICPPPAPTC